MPSDPMTQLQRMESILKLSRDLTSTISLEPLLHKIVGAAAELTDSEAASILLLNERTGKLRFIAASILGDRLADIPVPVEGSIAGAAFTSGEPLIIPDVRTDRRYYKRVEQQVQFEARSLLAVPLQFREHRIGVLEAENKRSDEGFDQEDVETLTMLAAQATVAIENARLMEALKETHDMTEALRRSAATLSSSVDYQEVLDHILEQLSRLAPQTAANIMLIEDDTVSVHHGHGYEQFGAERDFKSISFKLADVAGLRKIQQTGQPLVIPHVESYAGWVDSEPAHPWIKSYVGVPIRVHNRVIGFLNMNSAIPNFFGQADAERLQIFADHAAIAIENSRLYRRAQREIIERKRAEEEVRKHRDHLEQLVEERTAKLTNANQQLRRYTQELKERNAELDAFAHTVAHDLKSPLALITSCAEVLEEYPQDEEALQYLHKMTQRGYKMSAIIDELLLLSSVRKLKEVKIEPLDMVAIVAEAQKRLAGLIEQHQAQIILPAKWVPALGYGPWVEEVWVNYISNALKYGGRPPQVELGAVEQTGGGLPPRVRFWVRDNGPGLTPEEQEQLFAPFTRLDQVRIEGHGLGLSIVRRIIDKLGGQIGVESQVGQGSTFSFTLPSAAT